MTRGTPFHERTSTLNQTGLWTQWASYRTPVKFRHSQVAEYFAVRNAAGLFDTSPLFKYRFTGRGAGRYLAGLLARDVRRCRPGRAQYTMWCDDRGYVVEDGLVLHTTENEYWLTSAEPNMAYFRDLAVGGGEVLIEDLTDDYGILALQGPAARSILAPLVPEMEKLRTFGLLEAKLGSHPVLISRTGFTGDLGYEVWVERESALDVYDTLLDTGADRGLLPVGGLALRMLRIEAGLLLLDVDFESSRFAFTDDQRATPVELGYGWMFRDLAEDDRAFVGRRAIEAEIAHRGSRWRLVGLTVDWQDHQRVYASVGIPPTKDPVPIEQAMMIYDGDAKVGFSTSFMYSPLLQRHIGLARVPVDRSLPGTELDIELSINHTNHRVRSRVTGLPFFDPQRKRT